MQTRNKPTGLARVRLAPNASAAAVEFVGVGVRIQRGGLLLPVGCTRFQWRGIVVEFGGLRVRDGPRGVAGLFERIGDGYLVGNWTRHDLGVPGDRPAKLRRGLSTHGKGVPRSACLIQAIIGPSMRNATAYTAMAMSTAMVSTTTTAIRTPRNVLLLIPRDYPGHVKVTHP